MTATPAWQHLANILRSKPSLNRNSRQWASLGLIASSILIVGTTAVTSYGIVRGIIIGSLEANAKLTVEKTGQDIDQWLSTRLAEIETLSNQLAVRSMHLEAVIPFLSLEVDRLPDYQYLMYGYPDGSHYRTEVGFTKDQKISSEAYFKQAMAGTATVSSLISSDQDKTQQISIAAPIWSAPPLKRSLSATRARFRAENLVAFGLPKDADQQLKPIGVLTGVIPIKHIAQVVAAIPKQGDGSYAFVLDAKGMPIASPNAQLFQAGKSALQPSNPILAANPALKTIFANMVRQKSGVQPVKLGNQEVYIAYAPLHQTNWSLALVIPKAQAEQQLSGLNTLATVVGVLLAIASLIALKQIGLLKQAEARSVELAQTNHKLYQEVQERERAEAKLLDSQAELEHRVAARTTELAAANQILLTSETQLRQQAAQLEQALYELQSTQSQLVQTEKMSSLGQLVAGVAHEINNPINFIHANLPYADQYVQDLVKLLQVYQRAYPNPMAEVRAQAEAVELEFLTEDLAKLLTSMRVGTDRIRQLVLSLRNFSRLDEADMKRIDIHEGIDSTLLILQNRLKAKPDFPGIEVIKTYNISTPIACYAGQLNQVFMNILANAIDALEEQYAKSPANSAVTVVKPAQPTIWIQTTTLESGWVEIQIKDNGPGISETVRQKIFDPFFTTKPVGKGTGIGMSISYQIVVEKHGGQLLCHSLPENGAEFVIRIPQHQTRQISSKVLAFDRAS